MMRLLQIAARVAAHVYRIHWAARTEVLREVDQVFSNADVYPPKMKEVFENGKRVPDTYEGMVKGTGPEDLEIKLNDKPVKNTEEAVETFKKLKKERGTEVRIAPFSGHVEGLEYDLRKYDYDHSRTHEELEVAWTDSYGNKIELSAVTSPGGTAFTKVEINGADVTKAASEDNWEEVTRKIKRPSGTDADIVTYIFKPASQAVEDSAEKNAKDLERWDTGPGTFFDWVKREGYSIKDGVLKVTSTED